MKLLKKDVPENIENSEVIEVYVPYTEARILPDGT